MEKNKRLKENSWETAQTSMAEKSGLAIVVVDENSSALSKANNNSICQILYSSEQFAPECGKYCGRAFQMAAQTGQTADYRCYAGLDCRAVPIKDDENKTRLVAIVGRVFTKSENYRNAATRAVSGDWSEFPSAELFENVLLSASTTDLEKTAGRIENLSDAEKAALFEFAAENAKDGTQEKSAGENGRTKSGGEEIAESAEQFQGAETLQTTNADDKIVRENIAENEQIAEWRSLFGSLLDLSYRQACAAVLQFLSERYSLKSLAWLECRENRFDVVSGTGKFENFPMRLGIAADDARLLEAARAENSLELLERKNGENDSETAAAARLFPVAVGGEIKSGLLLGDGDAANAATRLRRVGRFCRTVAADLEILRLREELARRGWLARAVRKLNDNLRDIDSEDFWLKLAQISAELMKAERASLLLFDEKTALFEAKAAIGAAAEQIKTERGETLGARVAKKVLASGKPLVSRSVEEFEIPPAPPDWKYKTKSFISYPIEIGGRKIGVLNFTDKTGGEDFGGADLDLLGAIVPQMAVLIDRSALKHKAGEFEQLSVTDALTGLLNRRYLEERLAEEIRRSNRNGFSTSFLMIDVDDFKSYNDNFSHPEGDKALKLVAQSLKETLRGADVAARYGGEEFSILLPQTNSVEAGIIAERIRERVEAADFPHRRVTVSIGVASCSQSISTAATVIKAADDALYEAKRRGRNNVRIYGSLGERGGAGKV